MKQVTHPDLPFTIELDQNGKAIVRFSNFSLDGTPADAGVAILLQEIEGLKQRVAALEKLVLVTAGAIASEEEPVTVVDATPEVIPDLVDAGVEIAEPQPVATKVNPNIDSIEAIEGLPYIGAAIAEKIVTLRQEAEFADYADFYKRTGLRLKAADKESLAELVEFKF